MKTKKEEAEAIRDNLNCLSKKEKGEKPKKKILEE